MAWSSQRPEEKKLRQDLEGRAELGYDRLFKPREKINTATSSEGGHLSPEKARVSREMGGKDKPR